MTIEYIQELEYTTELEREIKEIIINNVAGYENTKDFFIDLSKNGCISGMLSELVYYSDTIAFCKRHKEDNNSAIYEIMECYGAQSTKELFGDKFDDTDFLCIGEQNQNLITWFIFEETCSSIYRDYQSSLEVA